MAERGEVSGYERSPGQGPGSAPASASAGIDVPLESKLHAPGPRPGWVERPALIGRLVAARAKLVLVDAPAGYGKTTLIAQWRRSAGESRPFAWISLDVGDNDPVRFWSQVVHVLHRACPELAARPLLDLLRPQRPDITGTLLPLLANELAALTAPVILVLDDYHLIRDRGCQDQVAVLLRYLPPTLQLAMTTRADPRLPLARLRSTGDMVEVRMNELRFGAAEASALVERTAGVRLAETDLAELVRRTEGWPAGVYLAALSLRGNPSPADFIRQFSGDSRYIADLLAEEVLSRQPDHIRHFLTRTAILDRFSAPLCDAVVGSADAADIIEMLERENLFVIPVDENRGWYRYHRLFRQLLRSRLARSEASVIPALHRRASAWHRESGSAEEAIGHALAGGDVTGAVTLIARRWFAYADAGRLDVARGWLRTLGEEEIAADPVASHCAAWVAATSGDRPSVARWLPVVEAGEDRGPLPDGMRSLRSSAALLRGVFGFDGLPVMGESARMAVELEDDPASPWYALARAALGFNRYLSGELDAAAAPLEEAVASESRVPLIRVLVLSLLCLVAARQGKVHRARDLARMAGEIPRAEDARETPQGAFVYLAAGALQAGQGHLDEASRALEQALRLRRAVPGSSPWPTLEALLLLAEVRLALGDPAAAELLAEARDLLALQPDGTDALAARLRQLGQASTPASRASLPEPLTEREATVLRLLRGTLSLREIGQELNLSQNTIKTHTRVIYRKLGVSTRREAIEQGRRMGVV